MTTTPALNDDLVRETEYVLLKRDLFECARHQGYTGIRDKAGSWSLEYVQRRDLPVKDAYDRSHEHYALPLSAAPEFTRACFDDLARDHLIEQRDAQANEIEALRAALEPFAEAGQAMLLTGGREPKISGPRLAEHLERARTALKGAFE